MDKMYFDYLKERSETEVYVTSKGFATYKPWGVEVPGDAIYLVDLYVKPEFRNTKHAVDLGDAVCRIGQERGCKYLVGSVVPSSKGSTHSLNRLLSYGMTLAKAEADQIWLIKELD